MAERSIPIDVQLKLVEIPPNIAGVLETIGKKLQSIGQVKIAPAVLPTGETKRMSDATRELDAVNRDASATIDRKLHPSFQRQAEDYSGLSQLTGGYSKQTMQVAQALRLTGGEAKRFADAFEKSRLEIVKGRAGLVLTAGAFRSTGLAIRRLFRDVFWLGLGVMFITMAFARMRRNAFAVERQMYSVRTAYRAVIKAQDNLNESLMEYGYGSEEAREAQDALDDSLERVKVAENAARMAVEQHIYSLFMLGWGTIPTVIRGTFDLTTNLQSLYSTTMLNVAASQSLAVHKQMVAISTLGETKVETLSRISKTLLNAQTERTIMGNIIQKASTDALTGAIATETGVTVTHVGVLGALKAMIWGVNSALVVKLVLTSALTFGIMALSFAISHILIEQQMKRLTEDMKRMREEMGLTDEALAGSGLVESLYKTRDALNAVNQVRRDFTLGAGELGRAGAAVNIRALNIGAILINATVRREDDIRKIRASLDDLFIREYRRRGGY